MTKLNPISNILSNFMNSSLNYRNNDFGSGLISGIDISISKFIDICIDNPLIPILLMSAVIISLLILLEPLKTKQ